MRAAGVLGIRTPSGGLKQLGTLILQTKALSLEIILGIDRGRQASNCSLRLSQFIADDFEPFQGQVGFHRFDCMGHVLNQRGQATGGDDLGAAPHF